MEFHFLAREIDFPAEKFDFLIGEIDFPIREFDFLGEKFDFLIREFVLPTEKIDFLTAEFDFPIREIDFPTREIVLRTEKFDFLLREFDFPTGEIEFLGRKIVLRGHCAPNPRPIEEEIEFAQPLGALARLDHERTRSLPQTSSATRPLTLKPHQLVAKSTPNRFGLCFAGQAGQFLGQLLRFTVSDVESHSSSR